MNHPVLKSKKAVLSIVAAILGYFCVRAGFTEAQIGLVLGPLVAGVGAEMFVDRKRVASQPPAPPGS